MVGLCGTIITRMTAKPVDWKKALITNRVALVKGLADADAVADILYSDKILTEEMRAKITQEKESEKKARELLNILDKRGQNAVCCLYKAFKDTQNEALADLLIPYVKEIETNQNLIEPKKWPPTKEEQAKMAERRLETIKNEKSVWLNEYNKDDVYRMQKKTRGMVFIINNENFKTSGRRLGTVLDGQNMTELFLQLQFKVIEGKDLPAKEMVNFLEAERKKVDWKEMECVILILMSHGEDCNILGSDDEPVPLKTLTDLFSSPQCKYLDGKPRLVFVQACRSEGKCKKPSTATATDSKTSEQKQKEDQTDSVPYKQTSDQNIKHTAIDFLVAYATPEGTSAYRNIHTGSWFLTAVLWTFKAYAYKEHLQELLTRVNRLVARGEGETKFLSTVSEIKNNLTKKFYFFPGVYDNPPRLVEK